MISCSVASEAFSAKDHLHGRVEASPDDTRRVEKASYPSRR